MIKLNNNDWIQWDNQIKTFRAEINNIIYGKYTGEFQNPEDLQQIANLSQDQIEELNQEKINDI